MYANLMRAMKPPELGAVARRLTTGMDYHTSMSSDQTSPDLAIAVDGGNTKTIAVIVTTDLEVVGVGIGGCTDIYNAQSPAAACAELSRVIRSALSDAGCEAGSLDAGVFSLAGADWPEDHELLVDHLSGDFDFDLDGPPLVVNDAIGGLRVGAPDWEGMSVICGTGNAVAARRRDGTAFHVGFWPDVVGAPQLSRDALNAVYRDHLDLGPPTSLTGRALEAYQCSEPFELLHLFTRRGGLGPTELVRMSPILLDEADAGDAVALDLVTTAGRNLGRQARACATQVGLPVAGTIVVMGGGVFQHPTSLLEANVMAELDGAIPVRMACPPVVGAMMAALDRLGICSSADALHRSLKARIDVVVPELLP